MMRLASRSNLSLQVPEGEEDGIVTHRVESRSTTAFLPPVLSKIVDLHPLTWLGFEEDCIMTACSDGHLRTWERPREDAGEEKPSEGST